MSASSPEVPARDGSQAGEQLSVRRAFPAWPRWPGPADDALMLPTRYNVAFSGNGVVSGRPDDTFGVGWSRLQLTNKLVPFLRHSVHLGLDHWDAIELYYILAATKWLGLTADLQIGRSKSEDPSPGVFLPYFEYNAKDNEQFAGVRPSFGGGSHGQRARWPHRV